MVAATEGPGAIGLASRASPRRTMNALAPETSESTGSVHASRTERVARARHSQHFVGPTLPSDTLIPPRTRITRLALPLARYHSFLIVLLCTLGTSCDRSDERITERSLGSGAGAAGGEAWFTEITSDVRLDFVHESGAKGRLHLAEVMGAGAALFDYDNDGDLDIYLTNGNLELPRMVSAVAPLNRLYRQQPGGRFVDVTIESNLGDGGYGMGVAIADIDNDGDTDVYVTNFGPDKLYRNRGDGTFEDITAEAGIDVAGWSCSAVFFDYDLDGFLDLYVTQYVELNPLKTCTDGAGRTDYCGPTAFPPVHDVLLHNNGGRTFTDVSDKAGIAAIAAAGLGVISEDLNDDGLPDIYVANDAFANQLWINMGDGSFRDDAFITGTAYNWNGVPEAGMGILAADFDNDANLDLFLTHLGAESNTLYRNLGEAFGFSDITGESGLAMSSVPFTGFGTCALDVELDGDLDVIVVNGRVVRGDPCFDAGVPPPWDMYAEPNLFFLNDGTGRFESGDALAGSLCSRVEITRGLVVGDVDADGDQDVLLSNVQGPARLYRNDAPRLGHWLSIRAVDPELRRDAIGARVSVFIGDRQLIRTITSGSSYLSASEPEAHFGLGDADRPDRVEVRWPGGAREMFHGVPGDQAVTLVRGAGESKP